MDAIRSTHASQTIGIPGVVNKYDMKNQMANPLAINVTIAAGASPEQS